MTHPTDKELDTLVEQQTRAANKRDEFEALMNADRTVRAITALRAQLAEAKADKEKLGRELNLARYGQPVFSWQVHKEALAAANARADRAEAALAAQIEADAWQPIETAPKDGTQFQAWLTDGKEGREILQHWEPLCRFNQDGAFEIWGRIDYDIDGWKTDWNPVWVPTNWKPHPARPAQPHDRTALDRLLADAEAKALRRAAKACDWGDIYGDNAVKCIIALIPKGGEA